MVLPDQIPIHNSSVLWSNAGGRNKPVAITNPVYTAGTKKQQQRTIQNIAGKESIGAVFTGKTDPFFDKGHKEHIINSNAEKSIQEQIPEDSWSRGFGASRVGLLNGSTSSMVPNKEQE